MTRASNAQRLMPLWVCILSWTACHERRHELQDPPPTYGDLAPLFAQACLQCHGDAQARAGYSLADHWSAIGCTSDGRPATSPADHSAPLLSVFERDDHRTLLAEPERARLLAWVAAGTPQRRSVIHSAGILDPRGAAWHGALAAADGYRPLRDAQAENACGRCHRGAPVAPAGKTGATDGATPCSDCHTQPAGALACSTCHGDQGRSYPPRDVCYFGGAERDPHAAHVATPRYRAEPLACDTCHPLPDDDLFASTHANGRVDVRFASPLLDETAIRRADGSCSVACHTRGGSRSEPDWSVRAGLDCQSCHRSPPPDHPAGPCSSCHANMGDEPDSLHVDARHIDGVVQIGDGRGRCGACHGNQLSGAPEDPGHALHLSSAISRPIDCDACHRPPTLQQLHEPASHMNGVVDVAFGPRAARGDQVPFYDAAQKTCVQVACHGDKLLQPAWGAPAQPIGTCSACHDTPPPPPHSALPGCGGGFCHGSEVAPSASGFGITESGRMLHIDGIVQAGELH